MAWEDLKRALAMLLTKEPTVSGVAAAIVSLTLSWTFYVPVHEMMHVAGCLATGGSVTEVRLAPIYGGTILAALFPFVTDAGSGYPGRLTGFDTHGSDLCYLATDLAPYLLTILIGVPLLRSLSRRKERFSGWLFGPAVVLASAPFLSLMGDYFEMGTVLMTAPPILRGFHLLRSDDLFRMVGETSRHEINPGPRDLLIVLLSLGIAFALASWTYRAGVGWDAILIRWGSRASQAPAAPRR